MMSAPSGSWVVVPCENPAAAPIGRASHTCVVYKDCLYVFGGNHGATRLNDFHLFSFTDKRWMQVPDSGHRPSARNGHSCVVYNDALYVLGGHDGHACLNDSIEYNFEKAMYCFGGYRGTALDDFHDFNFETRTWTAVQTTGTAPEARYGASLVVFDQTCILFGGEGVTDSLNDVHTFDFSARVWSRVMATGSIPSRREGHVAAVYLDAMYVFGGVAESVMNDLSKLTLAAVYNSSLFVFGGKNNDNNFTQFRFEESMTIPDIPGSSLIVDLRKLVNNQLTSDITFVVEGSPIYALKNLCMRCDYFKAMLTGDMLESRAQEVVIPDVRRPIFLSFLEYLYTDEIDVPAEDAMELLVVANQYGVDRLMRICERRLLLSLSVDNAATILYSADLHNAATLRVLCIQFILNNFDAVSKTMAFVEMSTTNVELALELFKLR